MKVSREKAAEHRAKIVKEAGRLFRAKGFEGVGVAEIMQAAGLTHGGFYGHFASKDALAAEACAETFAETFARLPAEGDAAALGAYLDTYLSPRHRDRPAGGCAMAAYGTEVARQDEEVQAAFADGVGRFADAVEARLPPGGSKKDRRARALTLLAGLIGGLTLARATAEGDPALSDEILKGVRLELDRLVAKRPQIPAPCDRCWVDRSSRH